MKSAVGHKTNDGYREDLSISHVLKTWRHLTFHRKITCRQKGDTGRLQGSEDVAEGKREGLLLLCSVTAYSVRLISKS